MPHFGESDATGAKQDAIRAKQDECCLKQYIDCHDAFWTKTDSGNWSGLVPVTRAYDNNDGTQTCNNVVNTEVWIQFAATYLVKICGARIIQAYSTAPVEAILEYQDYAGVWQELARRTVPAEWPATEIWEPTFTPVMARNIRIRSPAVAGAKYYILEIDLMCIV